MYAQSENKWEWHWFSFASMQVRKTLPIRGPQAQFEKARWGMGADTAVGFLRLPRYHFNSD